MRQPSGGSRTGALRSQFTATRLGTWRAGTRATPWRPVSERRLTSPRLTRYFYNKRLPERRGSQVVRQRSAKPLYVGSTPTRASRIVGAPAHTSSRGVLVG